MTVANLRPEPPVPAALAQHDPSLSSPASPDSYASPAALPTRTSARAAANDDAVENLEEIRNPLWIVAIGMACMFGVMAAVIALG